MNRKDQLPTTPKKRNRALSTDLEEIRSDFDLQIGRHITLRGSASITPKGVVYTGVAIALMTVALGCLLSSTARRRM